MATLDPSSAATVVRLRSEYGELKKLKARDFYDPSSYKAATK